MQLQQLIGACAAIAPEALAEEWDNVGLQVGTPDAFVERVLLTLDVTPAILDEARARGVQSVIAHHPLIFRPLRSLREDQPEAALVAGFVRAGIALYVMHTNLDLVRPGTSDALADKLGVRETAPLLPLTRAVGEAQYKLVVFVPTADAARVRLAMGDAQTGIIGNYSHCSFSALGTGSFRPLPGAHPAIGQVGVQEEVAEERVEVLVSARQLPRVLAAMLAAHPYEEVAYDLYPLAPHPTGAGLGRVGRLDAACSLRELAERVRERLGGARLQIVGERARSVARVALCGGSGGDLVDAAVAAGADVLITGDVKHHQALHALDRSLAVIDAGHDATERPVLELLETRLRERLPATVQLYLSTQVTDPFADR